MQWVLVVLSLSAGLVAQKPAAVAKTWMDLAVGTDLTWSTEGADSTVGGVGSGKSDNGKHEIRIVCLGTEDDGKLRLAIVDEHLPSEPHEVAIVNCEICLLDPATGELERLAEAATTPRRWSPLMSFPYPALSPAEFKAKKPLAKTVGAPVGGEPQILAMDVTFGKAQSGKKKVAAILAAIDPAKPAAIRLVGIAGMVAMSQGQMPKLGASGIEPVDAVVSELRREFHVDAKGRVLEVHTTYKFAAGDGKLQFEGNHVMRETQRRKVSAKELPKVVELMEAVGAITNSSDSKEQRRERAAALQPSTIALGFATMLKRLEDSMTHSGLPPGIGLPGGR